MTQPTRKHSDQLMDIVADRYDGFPEYAVMISTSMEEDGNSIQILTGTPMTPWALIGVLEATLVKMKSDWERQFRA